MLFYKPESIVSISDNLKVAFICIPKSCTHSYFFLASTFPLIGFPYFPRSMTICVGLSMVNDAVSPCFPTQSVFSPADMLADLELNKPIQPSAICSVRGSLIFTVTFGDKSAIGQPQFGHDVALSDTSLLHSGHFIIANIIIPFEFF